MAQWVKNLPTMQETQEIQVRSLGQEEPWRRKWQLTPVFLPEKSHGQRRLAVYSPKGQKELDTTEPLSMHAKFFKRVNCVICELNVNKAAINCTNFKTKMLYNILHVICNFFKMYRIRKKTRMKKEL